MWVRTEEYNSTSGKHDYDHIRCWSSHDTEKQKILGLALDATEEKIALCMSNNNIGLVNIKSIGLNEETKPDIDFALLCSGFHSGAISQIDVAVQRPIIVTLSKED